MSTAGRPLGLSDLDQLQLIGQARISPDGTAVAYILARFDTRADETATSIHVVSTRTGTTRQLTAGPYDELPTWSPDSTRLAFLRPVEHAWRYDVHVVAVDSGTVDRVAVLPRGVDALAWSPEGDGFALLGRPGYPGPAAATEDEKRSSYRERIVHVTRLGQKGGSGWLDDEAPQVWWCPLGGEPTQLSDVPAGTTPPRFAPDGRITYAASLDPDHDLHALKDLWSVSRHGGEPVRLAGPLNQVRGHAVLPDGRVAHIGVPGVAWHYGVVNNRLFVDGQDRTGFLDRPCGRLTEVQSLTLDYLTATEPPIVDHRGRPWFNVVDQSCAHVYRLDEDDKPVPVLTGDRIIGDFSLGGDLVAWTESSVNDPQTLRVAGLDGQNERVLVDANPWLADRALGEIRSLHLELPDGVAVQGWAVLPAHWDGAPLPSIVDVHAGPHTSFSSDFRLEQRLVAEQGYAVLSCNHPGSAGYGEDFAGLLLGNWGGDLGAHVELADEAARLGIADPVRTGITGVTSGAYSALWAVAKTDRFKAAVVNRTMADLWSNYGDADCGYWFNPAVLGAEPWEDEALYRRMSVLSAAQDITAPVRFLNVRGNTRQVTAQAEAVFIRLRKRRVPTDLLEFPARTATVIMPNVPSLKKQLLVAQIEWWERFL